MLIAKYSQLGNILVLLFYRLIKVCSDNLWWNCFFHAVFFITVLRYWVYWLALFIYALQCPVLTDTCVSQTVPICSMYMSRQAYILLPAVLSVICQSVIQIDCLSSVNTISDWPHFCTKYFVSFSLLLEYITALKSLLVLISYLISIWKIEWYVWHVWSLWFMNFCVAVDIW